MEETNKVAAPWSVKIITWLMFFVGLLGLYIWYAYIYTEGIAFLNRQTTVFTLMFLTLSPGFVYLSFGLRNLKKMAWNALECLAGTNILFLLYLKYSSGMPVSIPIIIILVLAGYFWSIRSKFF